MRAASVASDEADDVVKEKAARRGGHYSVPPSNGEKIASSSETSSSASWAFLIIKEYSSSFLSLSSLGARVSRSKPPLPLALSFFILNLARSFSLLFSENRRSVISKRWA